MKTAQRVIALVVLAGLAFWLWTIFFPSPEKIIRGNLLAVARDVSFSADENNLVKVARAQSVANFFASNVLVNITVPGHEQQSFAGRDEITEAVLASRQATTALNVKLPDINVTVAPGKNSATADVTVEATVAGENDAIVQEVKFTFEHVDGHWLIDKVETIRTVSWQIQTGFHGNLF